VGEHRIRRGILLKESVIPHALQALAICNVPNVVFALEAAMRSLFPMSSVRLELVPIDQAASLAFNRV